MRGEGPAALYKGFLPSFARMGALSSLLIPSFSYVVFSQNLPLMIFHCHLEISPYAQPNQIVQGHGMWYSSLSMSALSFGTLEVLPSQQRALELLTQNLRFFLVYRGYSHSQRDQPCQKGLLQVYNNNQSTDVPSSYEGFSSLQGFFPINGGSSMSM